MSKPLTQSLHNTSSAIASIYSSADDHETSLGGGKEIFKEMDSFHILEAVKTALQDSQLCSEFVSALNSMAGDVGIVTLVGAERKS